VETLKTLVMLAVLGGVGYGVYTSLHKKPGNDVTAQNPAPPAPPKLELPTGPGKAAPPAPTFGIKPGDDKFSAPPQRINPDVTSPPGMTAAPGNPAAPPFAPNLTPAVPVGPDKAAGPSDAANPFGPKAPDATLPTVPNVPAVPNVPTGPLAANTAAASANGATIPFAEIWRTSQGLLGDGRLADAHRLLSTYYDDPNLTDAETKQLRDTLDRLAGTVIYSQQHLLEPAYVVQAGEKLADIAKKYDVPTELLAKINGIENPASLAAGESLKVIRGPFDVMINAKKHELTLLLSGRYAGRFTIGVGQIPLTENYYYVKDKLTNPRYTGPDREVIEAGDPANPLGERLIALGDMAAIHGTNDPRNIGRDGLKGCISLSRNDMEDLYDILSVSTSKIILRK